MNKRLSLLILSVASIARCLAAPDGGNHSYIFSTVDYQHGLSNSAVISVFQDNTGLMWFGTYDGVNCYDGKDIDVYRSGASTGLTNNVIYRINQADDNCLWISTGAGLNRFSPVQGEVVASYDFPDAYSLYSNSAGNTWLIVNGRLSYYNTRLGRFVEVEMPPLALDEPDTRPFVTSDGTLWIFPAAGAGEMFQFSLDSFDHADTNAAKLQTFTSTFHSKAIDYIFYQNDVFCFVDSEKDLYMHDVARKSTIYLRNIAPLLQEYGEVKGIVPFYKDVIIGFLRNGLIRLSTSNRYQEEIINRNIRVFDMYNDPRQGILWVGSDGQGAVMYSKKYSIATNLMLNSLSPNLSRQVRSLMTDRYGGLWFGTKGDGLIHIADYRQGMDASKATVYFPDFKQKISSYTKGNKEFQIYTLQQSHYMDGFWVDAGMSGLFYYSFRDDRLQPVVDTLARRHIEIHGIHEVNDSTLYLATYGEGFRKVTLDRSDGKIAVKRQKEYRIQYEGRDITQFFAMVPEGDSILWLGSRQRGVVARFNKQTEDYSLLSLRELLDEAVDDILCMYRFADGRLYAGTTSGLICLTFRDGKVEAEYTGRRQGFINDMIHGILKDANDFLWLGTNKGLIKYNPANHSSHAYYYTGGVQIGEFCDGAFYKCPYTGNLFFGGIDGLLYLEQEVAATLEYYPDMRLRKLSVGGNEVNLAEYLTKEGIRLKRSENSFSLKFIIPEYVTGPNFEYSFKLDGYDDEWSHFRNITEASFSNVPAGDYVFRVRSKKDVFDTDYKVFSIPVKITPFWYETLFAKVLYVLLAALITLYVVYLLRRYLYNEQMVRKMQETELKNGAPVDRGGIDKRDMISIFTIIYQACDELRDENLPCEERSRKVELIRENMMALLFFSGDAISNEQARKLSPVKFTISGRIPLRDLAEEVMGLFEKRGRDCAAIEIAIPETLLFPLYKNAFRCLFYYLFAFVLDNKSGERITISAREEGGKMYLTAASDGGAVREFYETLSQGGRASSGERIDDIFQMNMFRHFVLSALEQMCEGYGYETDGGGRLTFTFLPAAAKPSTAKKRLLLLEDRDEMAWLITSLLSADYTVCQVRTVQSAFKFIRQAAPSLFLADMFMYADVEETFLEYVNNNRYQLSNTAFVPMLTWKTSTAIQQELLKWSDAHIVLPYDILFLKNVLHKAIYGKQEAKQIYVEELGDFADKIICSTDEQAEFIKRFLRVVEQNLDNEELGSTFIADKLAITPKQLYRKFKELSAMTPGDLVKNYRMERAARLLAETDLSIQEVIADIGFASRSYFYKEFTRKFGMTPKDYRVSRRA